MTTAVGRSILAALMFSLPVATARAETAADHVPDDALALLVVHDLAHFSERAERLMKIFEDVAPGPIPAPLAVAENVTGMGDGLDESGDAMLALLEGEDAPANPRPLLLVPVSDYAALAESIGGDASGEICRVTIAGEEVLVAKRQSFAVLMNVEHRERLETFLAAEPAPPAQLAPLADWMGKTDVAAVLTPRGVSVLADMGKAGLDQQRAQYSEFENQFDDPDMARSIRQMQQSLAIFDAMLGFLGAEVSAVGVGATIDDQLNVRLAKRVLLTKDGELAKVDDLPAADEGILAGYPAGPFVFAAGGPLPASWNDAMSKAGGKWMMQFKELYGLEDLDEKEWQKMEEIWKKATKGLRSMSFMMTPGETGDPLYSNAYGVIEVEDADAYIESYRESIRLWNEVMAQSTSDVKMQYEVSDVQIDGRDGILMLVDVAAAVNDPNVAAMQPMMEAMFGEDGKMRMYLVVADADTVVMGIGDEEGVAEAAKFAESRELGLENSAEVQTTLKLLDADAPWKGVVSPQGCVAWFSRMLSAMMAQFGAGAGPTIPEYPDSPPVGFSMHLVEGQFRGEMVVPVETLEGLAAYIETAQ